LARAMFLKPRGGARLMVGAITCPRGLDWVNFLPKNGGGYSPPPPACDGPKVDHFSNLLNKYFLLKIFRPNFTPA
jgi:hypothetical protein